MKKIFKWKYKPAGNCPVQSEGWFLGYYFYFRARWSTASIEFYKNESDFNDGDLIFVFDLKQTDMYFAGWLSKEVCKRLIYKGCFLFLLKLIEI